MFCTDSYSVTILESLSFYVFSPHAPPLLYYSHIPAAVVALALSLFIIVKNRTALEAKILVAIALLYSTWAIMNLFIWTQIDIRVIMYLWSFWFTFFTLIFVLCFYFLYAFIKKRDVSFGTKVLFVISLLPVILLAFTPFNLSSFDVTGCNAIENPLMIGYAYFLASVIFIAIVLFAFNEGYKAQGENKEQMVLVSLGVFLFLLSFSIATYIPSIFNLFESSVDTFATEMYGFFGMTVFIGFLTYLVVRYKAFNIKLLAAQALVFALVALIASEFFFVSSDINRTLVGVTLFLAVCFGFFLVRSVKREVAQREHIEKLAKQLEVANERLKELDRMKSEFLSIASHQLRAPITAIKGYASLIVQGDYGPVPDTMKDPLERVSESARVMASSIEDYLNISRIEQGTMKYEFAPVDIASVAQKVVEEMRPVALAKHLALNFSSKDGALTVQADFGKIKQVFSNLVDNAIKYTKEGSVTVTAEKLEKKVLITIADTGIGIAKEDVEKLFAKFTRAKDANKINTTGTGLGLYVAKQLVEGHKGTIRIESEGPGKGTRFIVELPV